MGQLERLTGVPWHVEKMIREEGDDRRHRSRCVYYQGKVDNFCSYYCEKCRGSAHCDHYKEHADAVETGNSTVKDIRKRTIAPFEGIKILQLKDIYVGNRFTVTNPKESKIRKLETFVKEHGQIDKPIVVSVKDGSYELEEKYLRYYVAKQLGISEIPAEMGSKEDIKTYDKLRSIGTLVWVKKNSEVGEVVDYGLEQVKIRLDSGKEIAYNIHKGVSSGSIRVL